MKERLIEYGFIEKNTGWLRYEKNEWVFEFHPYDNYMWLYPPRCGDDEGICLNKLTFEKTIKLIDFITEYE